MSNKIKLYGTYDRVDTHIMHVGTFTQKGTGVVYYDVTEDVRTLIKDKTLEEVIEIGQESGLWTKQDKRLVENGEPQINEWDEFWNKFDIELLD